MSREDVQAAVVSTMEALALPEPEPTACPTKPSFATSFSIVLEPGLPATMTYADDLGFRTALDFPRETVLSSTAVTLIPGLATEPPAGATLAGHAFVIVVLPGGQLNKAFAFAFPSPVLITLTYEATSAPEGANLQFLWWSGSEWLDPAEACTPPQSARANHALIEIGAAAARGDGPPL